MQRNSYPTDRRRGSMLVLASALMVAILAFTAFTVDLSYIALTKTQLQAAADGAALGAGIEMGYGFGAEAVTASTVWAEGTDAAQAVAKVHKNGDLSSTSLLAKDMPPRQKLWVDFRRIGGFGLFTLCFQRFYGVCNLSIGLSSSSECADYVYIRIQHRSW